MFPKSNLYFRQKSPPILVSVPRRFLCNWLHIGNGHVEATELLVQAKANIDVRGGDNRWTALMHQAANDKTAVMIVLLAAKMMMGRWGGDGNTALILAAQRG